MHQLIANTTRSINLRLIIALLLGLFLVLGVHASCHQEVPADRNAADLDAWPVRISSKK